MSLAQLTVWFKASSSTGQQGGVVSAPKSSAESFKYIPGSKISTKSTYDWIHIIQGGAPGSPG